MQQQTITTDVHQAIVDEVNKRIRAEIVGVHGEDGVRYRQIPTVSKGIVRIVLQVTNELVSKYMEGGDNAA